MALSSSQYIGISQGKVFLRAPSNAFPPLQNTYDDLIVMLTNYQEIGELEKNAKHGVLSSKKVKLLKGKNFTIDEEISLDIKLLNVTVNNWENLRTETHNKACDILIYDENYISDTAEIGRVILYKNIIIRISATCKEIGIYKINIKFNFNSKNADRKIEIMDIINGYADNMAFFGQYISTVAEDNGNMAFFGQYISTVAEDNGNMAFFGGEI